MKFLKKLIYKDGTTPLPTSIVAVIFAVMSCNAMTASMVFSYLPQLVKSYGTSEVDAGYKVGIFASSLFFARALFSMMWGKLADSKGKKITLIATTVSMAMATLLFGFSFNYYWALFSRFLQGAFNGIAVCAKSILSDVCDDTNIAMGMSIAIGSYSTGIIIGPSIGGFLAFPAEQYPNIFSKDSIFGRFNILLPNLVVVTVLAISIPLVLLVIPKDRKKKNKSDEKTSLISEAESIARYSEGSSFDKFTQLNDACDKYVNFSIEETGRKKDLSKKYYLILTEKIPEVIVTEKDSKFSKVLRMKDCLLCSLLFGLFAAVASGYDELFPLYAAAATQYNGLEFSTSQIGMTLLIVSVITLILQIFLSRFITRFGVINTFIFSNLLMVLFIPLTPAAGSIQNRYAFWITLLTVVFIVRLCLVAGYVTINLLLTNSVEADMIATANGIGLTTASAGRTFAPTLVGSLFSWALTNIKDVAENKNPLGFPFNQYFPFFMLSVLCFLNSIMVSRFPRYLDHKKDGVSTHAQDIKTNTCVTTLSVSSFKPVL